MKVLSIDFDFIISVDICMPHTDAAVIETELYDEILRIVCQHPYTTVYVSDNHADIVKVIREICHIKGAYLYNIDQHHDIVYKKSSHLTCGNWASRLIVSGEVDTYYWIPRQNSKSYKGNLPYKKTNLDEICKELFDVIFICKSSPWIPSKYDESFNDFIRQVQPRHKVNIIDERCLVIR